PFMITTTTLPTGTVGQTYSAPINQVGGAGTVTWQLLIGTLPAGLRLDPSSGVISGMPTQSGTFPVTIRATDSKGNTADIQLTVYVFNGFHITSTGLIMGTVGQPYSYTMMALGGTMPYGWMATGLPDGMSIDPVTGVISGTPRTSGTYSVTVNAHD